MTFAICSAVSPLPSGFRVSPDVWVSTWRTVTGRASGSTTGRTPSRLMRTRWFSYSGIHFAIGSSSRNRPSSNSIISAVETIGLVIDIRTKMVSFVIGTPFSRSRQPCASKWTTFPLRATRVTAPAIRPSSTYSRTKRSIRCRRSDDMPTDSGLPTTTSSAARGDGAASSTAASTAPAAAAPPHRPARRSFPRCMFRPPLP